MLYYTEYKALNRTFLMAATKEGLAYLGLKKDSLSLHDFAEKHQLNLEENKEYLAPYMQEFNQYFRKDRTHEAFDFNLDMYGTTFQKEVWQALLTINYGKTKSYQEIAKEIERPKASRAVGTAVGRNPLMIVVPCHRVIHKNGSITGYRGGINMKKELLNLEKT